MKMIQCAAIAAVVGGVAMASAKPYAESYAVVVEKETYADAEWKPVVDALVAKHDAELVQYQGKVVNSLPDLKRIFPKYTCFVAKPEETGFNHIVDIHRLTRKYDEDPYGDTMWGVVTGYTPADALRVANATQPTVVSDALLTAGMGAERWKTARFISTSTKGEAGEKKEGGEIVREQLEGDTTQFWVDAWNEMDPDAVISSAHASQRNLEMPYSSGNVVCREGKLFGLVTEDRLIGDDGFAKKVKAQGRLIPLNEPKRPKLYFAVGNCLIGDIPDKNSMALAMMGFGKANQMLGYTVTTWYGRAGWGALGYWEQMAGIAPLNEAFYFNNVSMLYRLGQADPELPSADWEVGERDLKQRNFGTVLGKLAKEEKVTKDIVGLTHDRDVVAFYGDPALEVRLDKDHTVPARRSVELTEQEGVWTATIHAHADHEAPDEAAIPVGVFFPKRLKNLELVSGDEFKPLLTDNHLLVTAPGPFKAGEDYTIVFKGEPID